MLARDWRATSSEGGAGNMKCNEISSRHQRLVIDAWRGLYLRTTNGELRSHLGLGMGLSPGSGRCSDAPTYRSYLEDA